LADIKTETFTYSEGGATLEGKIVFDGAKSGKRPGVVIFHSWTGPGPHETNAANKLAEMGYVAICADVYGVGIRPTPPDATLKEMLIYMKDRPLLRRRANAALARLRQHPACDASRVGAIGYCFGGATVLELARSGADIKGGVSFHGSLSTPDAADAKNIKAPLLVLHGAADPVVPQPEVDAFLKEMKDAGTDCTFVAYNGVLHAFTDPTANAPAFGAAYDEKAAKRSWAHMADFFKETLGA
jgi:dienelactone hydrolase